MRRNVQVVQARIALFCIVLFGLTGCGESLAQPASLSIRYDGTSAKVGHHMIAQPGAYCGETWTQQGVSHTSGTLPPGLQFDGSRIVGTPQQPGRWQVVVNFRAPECRGKIYPDQDVTVDFNIEGVAPRRIP